MNVYSVEFFDILPSGVTSTASAGFACDDTLILTRKILKAGKKRNISYWNNLN